MNMAKKITDDKLLEMLLIHGGVKGAAAATGLSQNAIYRRLQDDSFRSRYDSLQGVILASASASMAESLTDAVNALKRIVKDPDVSAGTRVSAADALLRHSLRYCEVSNVLTRLERLEDNQNTLQGVS